jgi:hypothetical protein
VLINLNIHPQLAAQKKTASDAEEEASARENAKKLVETTEAATRAAPV